MLARHPKTGAPIRVMNVNTSIWRDSKTLVWLDAAAARSGHSWDRWDIGVVGLDAWAELTRSGLRADVCILGAAGSTDGFARVRDWLASGHWQSVRILCVSKSLLEAIGVSTIAKLHVQNLMCLDEAKELYPYVGPTWDGTAPDAQVMLATILHYGRTFPVQDVAPDRAAVAKRLGLSVEAERGVPAPLWFVTQYYTPTKSKRAKEIATCLRKNVACRFVDKILLLNERENEPLPVESSKIQTRSVGGRLRFSTVLRWIYEEAPAHAIIVFANSDIYLDDTARVMWSVNMRDRFLSLLRWDDSEDPTAPPQIFGPRADSQDTWVVSAASVKARTWNWDTVDFPFGQGGCDNAINVEMLRQKFLVVNPAFTIRTHHVHMSGIRTYDPQDIVEKPMYMHLQPTGIHDMRADTSAPATTLETLTCEPSCPPFRGLSEGQRQSLYTMLRRKQDVAPDGTLVAERKIPIYELADVFQSREGLTYTYNSIVAGPTKASIDGWNQAEVSLVAACVQADTALIAPCPDEIATAPIPYMLRYLAKILVMRRHAPLGEFLGVNTPPIVEVLNLFAWHNSQVPVMSRTRPFQAWCKKAFVWFAQDGAAALPTRQEVDALREALRVPWLEAAETPARTVVVEDKHWCTAEFVESLGPQTEVLTEKTSLTHALAMLRGASRFIFKSGTAFAELLWVLPRGATVVEIQGELEPSAATAHLCLVAGVEHQMVSVPRVVPATRLDVEKAWTQARGAQGASKTPSSELPIVCIPSRDVATGFFAHAGDSFREMVQIWAERGYVTLQTTGSPHLWLGGVGKTLLYDRPTQEWLQRAPAAAERRLFGNPAGGTPWSFWPRRPRLVEELVAAGVGAAPFEERSRGVVFYGRSENSVQKGHRSKQLWEIACDEFVHLEGEAAYPFTQREYLERLATARWGLCLAGYGRKCHREIECMAMGCVPLVAPEVDMEHYAEPPVEGEHYFRVTTPSDILARLSMVTSDEWYQMSQNCRAWWRRNASAEGMWALTQKLASE